MREGRVVVGTAWEAAASGAGAAEPRLESRVVALAASGGVRWVVAAWVAASWVAWVVAATAMGVALEVARRQAQKR